MAFAGGAKLSVGGYNDRVAPGGTTLELRQLDDGYSADKAKANATRLLAEGAEVLFGFVGTASADAGAAVAQQQGAPFFAPFAAADTLRDKAHANVSTCGPAWSTRPTRCCGNATPLARSASRSWSMTTPWAAPPCRPSSRRPPN